MKNMPRLAAGKYLAVFALALLLAGCQGDIDDAYGHRSGQGAQSVNGTAVLGEMFQRAGHTVYSRSTLSPRIREKAQCIVWFPDDIEGPTQHVRAWLASWLAAKPGRTLIYVGRDFDAWPFYWKKIGKTPPFATPLPRQVKKPKTESDKDTKEPVTPEAASDGDSAEESSSPEDALDALESSEVHNQWDDDTDDEDSPEDSESFLAWELLPPWFSREEKTSPRKVRTLGGDPQWTEDIAADKLEIELNSRMVGSDNTESLLESEGDMLVGRLPSAKGQLFLVANGSFLLNVPLVNHEHRKLAGKLIDAIGPTGQTVVFLESGAGGPPIRDADPKVKTPSGFDILLEYPYFWIFLHVAFAGALYCVARWPVFGPPRELPLPAASDFGRHIEAMAEMLRRSRDRAFAYRRLLSYRQKAEEKRGGKNKPQS